MGVTGGCTSRRTSPGVLTHIRFGTFMAKFDAGTWAISWHLAKLRQVQEKLLQLFHELIVLQK